MERRHPIPLWRQRNVCICNRVLEKGRVGGSGVRFGLIARWNDSRIEARKASIREVILF